MKKLFKTISIFVIVLSAIVLIPFIYTFFKSGLSTNIADWGAFGDYTGGLLNIIISLASLIVLGYLTIIVHLDSSMHNSQVKNIEQTMISYAKLSDFYPAILMTGENINDELDKLANTTTNSNFIIPRSQTDIRAMQTHGELYQELSGFLRTFDLRFGHQYTYDFNSKQFIELTYNAQLLRDFVKSINHKIATGREIDNPSEFSKEISALTIQYVEVLKELKKELDIEDADGYFDTL